MTPRKKICPRCRRKLWVKKDFYTPAAPYCKECSRAMQRARYRRNRKVPDGIRYDANKGLCIEHHGYATSIYWSQPMIDKLRRLYPTTKNEDLTVEFGVSQRTIIRKAHELGVSKDPQWVLAHARRNCETMRLLNKYRGNSGQFRKGQRAT